MIIVEGLDLDLNLSLDLGQAQIDETDVEDVEARHQVLKREEADIKKIKTVNILKIKKRRSIKSINVDLLQILSHECIDLLCKPS
jgi:hypothetical protein